jgi:TM2 domain-containing membrane protein YozV
VANNKEALLWSIALPGFGQFLNGKPIKGIVFVFLEFLINVKGHFNIIIILSFQGDIKEAIEQADYQWLLFYPCLYFFAMWDACKDAGGGKGKYSFLPFVFCAYFVTVGCIYSSHFRLFGLLLGPVWLPILLVVPGIVTGVLLGKFITSLHKRSNVP